MKRTLYKFIDRIREEIAEYGVDTSCILKLFKRKVNKRFACFCEDNWREQNKNLNGYQKLDNLS